MYEVDVREYEGKEVDIICTSLGYKYSNIIFELTATGMLAFVDFRTGNSILLEPGFVGAIISKGKQNVAL